MKNPGNDEVIYVDYAKRGLVLRNLGDVDVLHVDLRETLSGHEKPRERRNNTHYVKHGAVVRNLGDDGVIHLDLRKTCFSREKP